MEENKDNLASLISYKLMKEKFNKYEVNKGRFMKDEGGLKWLIIIIIIIINICILYIYFF